MPCFLATSGTDFSSASRRMVTICSSVNRVFFMAPSVVRGRHSLKLQLVRKTPGRSDRHETVENGVVERQVDDRIPLRGQDLAHLILEEVPGVVAPEIVGPQEPALQQVVPESGRFTLV